MKSEEPARIRDRVRAVRLNWLLGLALLVAVVAALPLVAGPGLLNTRSGGDSPFLLQRVQQLETALRDGHFPARWMPDANYGYGYPFFHFYASLSLLVPAAFRVTDLSIVHSIQLAQLTAFLVAAWGAFLLARRWWRSDWAGVLAAVAYTVAPFHMVNVYVRGDSLAEFLAMACYPWVLLAADQALSPRTAASGGAVRSLASRVVPLALAYAALILSHNISALIFSPFLLLYLLLRASEGGRAPRQLPRTLGTSFVGALLALGLAAWFFVPALGERSLAQLESVTSGYFHYENHFRSADLLQTSFLFDYDPDGGRAFRMGLVQVSVILLGLVGLFVARGAERLQRGRLLFTTLGLGVATFMITPMSKPLWDALPLLAFTQFPWRFLSVQAFLGAIAAGGIVRLPGHRLLVPACLLLLLAAGMGGLRPNYLRIAAADLDAEAFAQYEWFTGNIGTTVSAEYLPPWVVPRPWTSAWLEQGARHRVQVLAGDAQSTLETFRTARQSWRIETPTGATIVFPTLYWPGWRAEVGAEPWPVQPAPGSGLMMLELPPGTHQVTLALGRTPLRLAAEAISLLTLMVVVVLLVLTWPRLVLRGASALLAALLLIALGARLLPAPRSDEANQTWDFAQLGFLHHDRDGVAFSGRGRLTGYSYSAELLQPGEPWQIELRGSGFGGEQVSLWLLTPAVHRLDSAPPLAVADASWHDERLTLIVTVPPEAPAGLVVPRLRIGESAPLLSSGDTRGDLFLRPIRVRAGAKADSPADRSLAVRLDGALFSGSALLLDLGWFTVQPLTHNLNVSLRLLNQEGELLQQFDTQPGHGFRPSSLWPAGEWVEDRLSLPLPNSLPEAAVVMIELYEIGGETRLLSRLGRLSDTTVEPQLQPDTRLFGLPTEMRPLSACFSSQNETIACVRGYLLGQDAAAIQLTLFWESVAETEKNYTRFVHLLDANGRLVAQVDGMPQAGTYPTSQWVRTEVVPDTVTLDASSLPAGTYRLVLGLYENLGESYPRLAAETAVGERPPDDAVPVPVPVRVP